MRFGIVLNIQSPPRGENIVKAFHQPYKRIGLFKDIAADGEPSHWSFEPVAPNRLIAGRPDEVIREIERYRAGIACESMIFLFRHPQGPDHTEVSHAA